MSKENQISVGIDLGTTFSVVASVGRDGRPITVPNDEGDLSTPSVVFFDSNCTVVGNEAVNASEFAPERAAWFAKRDVGEDSIHREILGNAYPPEVVLALILKKLKSDAELKIGPFWKAVVTVPAYFNEPRRKATQDAGRLAGIEVLDIINEPTAAAIAFGVANGFIDEGGQAKNSERVLVYDLGGGTFDVTLMDICGSDFETVGTAGDVHLGGMDWDGRVMHCLADQFEKEHGLDPRSDPMHRQKLLQQATRAKKTLTSREEAQVRFSMNGKNSALSISRPEFVSLTEDLVERTRMTVKRLLKESDCTWGDVTRLILVGGSTRMQMIQEMLEADSGLKCDRSLSPDEAVAHGAAMYAKNILTNNRSPQLLVSNVNSQDLGVLGRDPTTGKRTRQMMVARNTKLPATKRKKFVTSKDGQKEVVVSVVEGGTDSGEGATKIGKCRVSNLPDDLPKKSPVFVTFQYGADGRLSVSAELPTVDVKAQTDIQRSSGMSDEQLAFWKDRIEAGIKIDSDKKVQKPETGVSPKPKMRPNNDKKKTPKKSKVSVEPAKAQKPPKGKKSPVAEPAIDIPVFEEVSIAQVNDSKILVGDFDSTDAPSAVSQIDNVLDTGEEDVKKVDGSKIVIGDETEKPKSIKLDALDDFFKKID